MKRIISGGIFFISAVLSSYCADSTLLRKRIYSASIKERLTVIHFDDDGFLCSFDTNDTIFEENLTIHVERNKNIYDLYFQNPTKSWHQKMIHEKDCWKWFREDSEDPLIGTIYYSENEMTVTSDSKSYTINIKYENKRISIDLGRGRDCIFDMSGARPVFITDRDVTAISQKNGIYSFYDDFDEVGTEFSIENAPAFTDFSKVAFLIPFLFHIDYWFYPFITGIINISETKKYSATSYLTEGKTSYEPEQLQLKDGLPWASANGKGLGDVISIKELGHKNPKELVIMNGYQDKRHPDYYEKNSRVRALKITNAQTKKSKEITVMDIKDEQRFSLSELGAGTEYAFEILDVYAGTKYADLCIQYLALE